MPCNFKTATLGLATLLLTASPVWACPAVVNPPFPGFYDVVDPGGPNTSSVVVEISGLTSVGSAAGDSCAAAPMLPENLAPVAVSVVHAETGEPVGFGKFRADARARRAFCGQGGNNCVAFVASVTEKGVKTGTPLKMIIEALTKQPMNRRRLTNLAVRIAQSGALVAGGVDKEGLPHHHLGVFKPSSVGVRFKE